MSAAGGPLPLLWHLPASHYSEKVRWALDHKRVPHRRRAALPGVHMALALLRTEGAAHTLPILELSGVAIADSTAAIAALEQRFRERPLYPADPAERRRALALEDYFDEELGPAARLAVFHELRREPRKFAEVAIHAVPAWMAPAKSPLAAYGRALTAVRYGADDGLAAARARETIRAALDRIEAELDAGDGVHLVGGAFTVADLTAAALFFPVVVPEGSPLPADLALPDPLAEFVDSIRYRPGFAWVEATYRRYRDRAEPTRIV